MWNIVMLIQWLWFVVMCAEPVVCESWCAMLYQWWWIMENYAQPVLVNHGVMLSQWLWISVLCWTMCVEIMVCYSEPVVGNHCVNAVPVVVNHCLLYCASRCDSWWVLLSQWLWTIVSYAEAVVVKHCELCRDQCVGIMMCYAEPVGVNHCELCWASGCESWCAILCK